MHITHANMEQQRLPRELKMLTAFETVLFQHHYHAVGGSMHCGFRTRYQCHCILCNCVAYATGEGAQYTWMNRHNSRITNKLIKDVLALPAFVNCIQNLTKLSEEVAWLGCMTGKCHLVSSQRLVNPKSLARDFCETYQLYICLSTINSP